MKTENNAVAYKLKNKCLELFSLIGGTMSWSLKDNVKLFYNAYKEDPKVATKVLFYGRGARKGCGIKKTFDNIASGFSSEFVVNNFDEIVNNGCARDIFKWLRLRNYDYKVIRALAYRVYHIDHSKDPQSWNNGKVEPILTEYTGLRHDLLLKWFPRSGKIFTKVRDNLNITNKTLRQLLASVETVETLMSKKEWSKINYSTVPGGAMRKYYKAFATHDKKRFDEWKESKAKAKVSATYPHDIAKIVREDAGLAIKLWDCLPNYLNDKERPIVISDTSGSMQMDYGDLVSTMDISVALGIYCSERMEGPYKDKLITFSEDPDFHDLSRHKTIVDKWEYLWGNHSWGMNTDFEKTYKLLLQSAKMWNVSPDEMPTMIICISDMQFDQATDDITDLGDTHHELMKNAFEEAGYKFPKLVYWNVRASFTLASPADDVSENTALISGFNPSVLEPILRGEDFNPMKVMYDSIDHIDLEFEHMPLANEILFDKPALINNPIGDTFSSGGKRLSR